MGFFISYSRHDEHAVQVLVHDLERTRNSIWMDRELGGGADWWQEILQQIRAADVFVLAVSTSSLRSRPCLTELEYATALGVPVLPVQVGDVESFRTSPIAEKQVLDYRGRTGADQAVLVLVEPAIDLVVATADLASRRRPLPDPLPAAPPIPYEYLMQIRLAIDAPEIPGRVQLQVLTQLKQALREEEDAPARRDVVDLLQRLRRHPDTTYRNAVEIDELLTSLDSAGVPIGLPPPGESPPSTSGSEITGELPPKPPWCALPEETQPVEGPAGTPAQSPREGDGLSVVAIGLGALGLGPLVPVIGVVVRVGAGVAFAVLLALTLVGVALSVTAVRRNLWLARQALAISLLGVVTVAVLLWIYIQAVTT